MSDERFAAAAPEPESEEAARHAKFAEALRCFVGSDRSRAEICRRCGVDYAAFTRYLKRFHPQYLRPPRRRKQNSFQQAQQRAARKRYRKALRLYAATDLTMKAICEQTGVSVDGFRRYVRRYHRDLLLRRNRIEASRREAAATRLRNHGAGQSLAGRRKYRAALAAAADERYIACNVSELARLFGLDATALGEQLRTHCPEVLRAREAERRRRGLDDNRHRGPRPACSEQYAGAVDRLRTGDGTIREAAEACGVSPTGLRRHLLLYHREIVAERARKRAEARNSRPLEGLNGAGSISRPSPAKLEQFRAAVELYRTTSLTQRQIAERTGVSVGGLRNHLHRWHRDLLLARHAVDPAAGTLAGSKRSRPAAAEKYAEAIAALKAGGAASVAEAAAACGVRADGLRAYLRQHEPRLAARFGQTKLISGRQVLARSSQKYAEALTLYRTTPEPLKSIAARLGLVYKSLNSFVHRNHPELVEKHNALVAAAGAAKE